MKENKSILVVEDDVKISRFLELELRHEGYDVERAFDGREGLEKALAKGYDTILLDLMLPKMSGIEVCRRIRNEGDHTPIIMLTAKDDVMDKVTGLDVGADDYMTKPFAIEELLARIRVAINRQRRMDGDEDLLRRGELTIDQSAHSVKYGDETVELTAREFALLQYLMQNKNQVLSRDKILNEVWGFDYMGETNVVDVYISYLRNKIDQRFNTALIETVRGVGYVIRQDKG